MNISFRWNSQVDSKRSSRKFATQLLLAWRRVQYICFTGIANPETFCARETIPVLHRFRRCALRACRSDIGILTGAQTTTTGKSKAYPARNLRTDANFRYEDDAPQRTVAIASDDSLFRVDRAPLGRERFQGGVFLTSVAGATGKNKRRARAAVIKVQYHTIDLYGRTCSLGASSCIRHGSQCKSLSHQGSVDTRITSPH
jgi:hypothetical protein